MQHPGIVRPMKSAQLGTFNVVASPINLTGVPKDIRKATAPAGDHTNEVLREVDYSDKDLEQLRAKGAI